MPDWFPPLPFARPGVLLLALPVAWAFARFGRTGDRRTDGLRGVLAGLLIAAAAGPVWDRSGEGLDVVLVLDRSRSMPAGAADLRELVASVEAARGDGDRVGVVTFGATAAVERAPAEAAALGEFARPVDADGTDLNAALHLALDLADPLRPARVVVLSDGEANGPDPRDAARRARAAGVPVDVRPFPVARAGDAAVTALSVPPAAAPGEPVAVGVTLFSPEPATGTLALSREAAGGGRRVEIGSRRVELPAGVSRARFRDAAPASGFHVYTADLFVPGDARRGNDRGEAGLRVDAPRRLLVLTGESETSRESADAFAAAFTAAGFPTDVRPAADAPLTQDALDAYGAVALPDVAADELGRRKLARLAQFVTDLGGGLLMTGGRNAYAAGGYAESPLEPLLPVDLDPRDDADRERTAIVVALDRSGSMAVSAGGGRTKMDLANDGAAAALGVLNRGDWAAVIAVDTGPEAFLPLTELDEPGGLSARPGGGAGPRHPQQRGRDLRRRGPRGGRGRTGRCRRPRRQARHPLRRRRRRAKPGRLRGPARPAEKSRGDRQRDRAGHPGRPGRLAAGRSGGGRRRDGPVHRRPAGAPPAVRPGRAGGHHRRLPHGRNPGRHPRRVRPRGGAGGGVGRRGLPGGRRVRPVRRGGRGERDGADPRRLRRPPRGGVVPRGGAGRGADVPRRRAGRRAGRGVGPGCRGSSLRTAGGCWAGATPGRRS